MEKPLNRILFVDNDQDILTIAKYCLDDLRYTTVKYLTSGEAAIYEALLFKPDLIIMNVIMPKMDGITTFTLLRKIPSLEEIPVVFITAKVQREEIANYLKMGVFDVIIKPFDPLTLTTIVENIWKKYTKEYQV